MVLPFKLVPSDVPISILEAMILGVPVISTDINGISELLKDNRGVLINKGDYRQLAKSIERLYLDNDYYNAISQTGKHYVMNNMHWQKTGDKFIELINGLEL